MVRERFDVKLRNDEEIMPMTADLVQYANLASRVFEVSEDLERTDNSYDAGDCRTRVMRLAPEIISFAGSIANNGLSYYTPLIDHLLNEWTKIYTNSPTKAIEIDERIRQEAGKRNRRRGVA